MQSSKYYLKYLAMEENLFKYFQKKIVMRNMSLYSTKNKKQIIFNLLTMAKQICRNLSLWRIELKLVITKVYDHFEYLE